MRLATFNVNGLRARLDFVLHWLRARQPDVVGLQELKLADEHFPHEVFAPLGYRAVTHGQKAWNGVAILARHELRVVQAGLPGQTELGARLLSAEVAGVTFTTVYVPNGTHTLHEDFPRKLVWLDALADHFAQLGVASAPHLLCGDFNLCPAPIDSWNEPALHGRIFHTDAERERWQRLLAVGFTDLFRAQHPEAQAFSWWDYRDGAFHRGHGLRIDFVLGSASLAARVKAAEIDREYRKKQDGFTASDHAPVWADFD